MGKLIFSWFITWDSLINQNPCAFSGSDLSFFPVGAATHAALREDPDHGAQDPKQKNHFNLQTLCEKVSDSQQRQW